MNYLALFVWIEKLMNLLELKIRKGELVWILNLQRVIREDKMKKDLD